jgi:hypothetical protein
MTDSIEDASDTNEPCNFFHFGLIVTGKAEEDHLPKLFRSLVEKRVCSFKVLRRIGQRNPREKKRTLKMVGSGKKISDKDQDEIGLPAREYLQSDECCFVILVDDLEKKRRDQMQQVFERYRLALDTILKEKQKRRASVHFLINMLEAYYFADANAVNGALELSTPLEDYEGDVETINNPKADMRKLYPQFNEREVADKVLGLIDILHVLSNTKTCASLRTLFAWCVKVIKQNPLYEERFSLDEYRLNDGVLSDVTKGQLDLI